MISFFKRLLRYFFYFISGASIIIFGIAAYLAWFQPTFYFPKPTGSYAVGVRQYHWIDTDRPELFAHDPAHPNRELMAKIWYPTDGILPKQPTTLWAEDLVNFLKKNQKIMWLLLTSRVFYCWSQPESPFVSGSLKFPVIIFSHGYGMCNQDSNVAQCEELASHGYIVVAINHTYYSILTTFSDGRVIDGYQARKHKQSGSNFTEIRNISNQELEVWMADVRFVLDKLEELTKNTESIFYQRLDVGHIGMFGHSFGGSTTVQMCRRDAHIKAGVDLDGGLGGFDVTAPIDKPLMFMINEGMIEGSTKPISKKLSKEFKITNNAEEQAFKEWTYLSALKLAQTMHSNVYILSFKNFGHLDFSFGAQLKHASPFVSLFGNMGSQGMIGTINGYRATEIVNAHLLNFFNKYLKGQPSELLDSKRNRYPEVEIMIAK